MKKVFISYRRQDSQYQADRLHAALKAFVPDFRRNIFIDVDNIPIGTDFPDYLDGQVAQCDVLLALIGPTWLDSRAPSGERRLDDPHDFVRIEIASALRRGIPVAPVLLDGTPVPSADALPEDLKPLARRNGVELKRLSFDADVARLIRGLGFGDGGENPASHSSPATEARVASPTSFDVDKVSMLRPDRLGIDWSIPEAFMCILMMAAISDGEMSQEESDSLRGILFRSQTLRRVSQAELAQLYQSVTSKVHSRPRVLEEACNAVPLNLRPSVVAHVVDILLEDGELTAVSAAFLNKVVALLGVSTDEATTITQVILTKAMI